MYGIGCATVPGCAWQSVLLKQPGVPGLAFRWQVAHTEALPGLVVAWVYGEPRHGVGGCGEATPVP